MKVVIIDKKEEISLGGYGGLTWFGKAMLVMKIIRLIKRIIKKRVKKNAELKITIE